MSSNENTHIKLLFPVYLDHVEVGVRYESKSTATRRRSLGSSIDKYFHSTAVEVSNTRQISIGGPHHLSTNGVRLFREEKGIHHKRFKAPERRKYPSHNQLSDAEKQELQTYGNQPWKHTTKTLEKSLCDVIDFADHNLDVVSLFPLKCSAIEFYKEFPLPGEIKEFASSLSRAVSRIFGTPDRELHEVVTDQYKIGGIATYWKITTTFADNSRRHLEAKAYIKGCYIRLEIKIRPQELVSECRDPRVFVEALNKIGDGVHHLLDQVEEELNYQRPAIDFGKLRDAIQARISIKQEDPAITELFRQLEQSGCYEPSVILQKESRLSDGHLKILSRRSDAIFKGNRKRKPNLDTGLTTNGRGKIYVLQGEWENIAAKPRPRRGRRKKDIKTCGADEPTTVSIDTIPGGEASLLDVIFEANSNLRWTVFNGRLIALHRVSEEKPVIFQ